MASELRFPVEIDSSQASKELDKLERQINKLKEGIAKNEAERAPIVEQLKQAQDAAVKAYERIEELKAALAESEYKTSLEGLTDPEAFYAELQKQAEIKAELAEQEKIMQAKEKEAQKLEAQDAKILEKLESQTTELDKSQQKAGELTQQITDASKGADIKETMASAQTAIKGGVKSLLKYGLGIRSLYVLFRKLKQYTIEAVKAYAENDPETKQKINELKASLAALKASWGAAFAPILSAVIPVLKKLIDWITAVVNAISMFFAILAGKSTFKKAVASTGELSDNLGGAADNAKEAKKELMGIDTLNVMSDNDTSSGGGGGSGGDGYDWVEEAVDLDSFTGKLALSFKDVFLDWDDLTGEQIAEKIIAGLAGLAGGVAGFMIGGVPGAIIGTLAGLAIGLIVDSIIFDHDGQLSKDELFKSLLVLLTAVAGGVIGFMIGGVPGAAIGATVGVALGLAVRNVNVEAMSAWNKTSLVEKFMVFLGGLAGGAIGFALGGPAGAVLGAAIGIGLMLIAKNVDLSDVGAALSEGGDKILEKLKTLHANITQKWDTMLETVKGKVRSFKESIVEKFEALKSRLSNIVETIKSLFNFEFHLPQLRLPHIQVQWQAAGALAKFLGISAIPHLSVAWYAKGGIVDGATLIGAGEAGKEAIVPLERNTQWVNMVAQELSDLLFDCDIFSEIAGKIAEIPTAIDRMTAQLTAMGNIAMPAVATGTVVPPNTAGSNYSGISSELESKIAALLDKLGSESTSKITASDVYLDKRKVGEITYSYIEERNRGRGK